MAGPPPRKPLLVALTLLGTLAAGLSTLGQAGGGGPQEPAAEGQPGAGLTPEVYPTGYCRPCHNQGENASYTPEQRKRMICRMTESYEYEKLDKHPLAFRVLLDGRGREIARRLGHETATEIDACVKCHATLPISIGRVPDLNEEQLKVVTEDGVTCVACHGMYAEWVDEHPKGGTPTPLGGLSKAKKAAPKPRWLELTREQKQSEFGMTDLWDPVTRAETCSSCHIGSVKEGKVLTHAMYAAGHPPLPSFEAASFSNAQPRHWEYLREKVDDADRAERIKPPIDQGHREQTAMVAISGLITLREAVRLFVEEAEKAGGDPMGPHWPDFARYDCAACHHDLRTDSWRQRRGYAGAPGRPPAAEWPMALVWLGIDAAADNPAGGEAEARRLDGLLDAFQRAVTERPFGDRSKAVEAARAVGEWADGRVTSLREAKFDEGRARGLLRRLVRLPQRAPDYDSARQIAWAIRAIYHEITPEGGRSEAVEGPLGELARLLALDLPPAKQQERIEGGLAERLRAAADYDPGVVAGLFARLAGALGE